MRADKGGDAAPSTFSPTDAAHLATSCNALMRAAEGASACLACFDAVTAGIVAKKAAHLGFDLPQTRLSNPNPERAAGARRLRIRARLRTVEWTMMFLRRWAIAIVVTVAAATSFTGAGQAEKTLRAVMHSDLKILDPIWTTAYIVRNHGYMIYDTLFCHRRQWRDQAADGRQARGVGRQAHPHLHLARRPRSGTTASR